MDNGKILKLECQLNPNATQNSMRYMNFQNNIEDGNQYHPNIKTEFHLLYNLILKGQLNYFHQFCEKYDFIKSFIQKQYFDIKELLKKTIY